MESLYTKYRPQTFEQVVGQTHVVETLKRAVLEGRTSHAYLFCGPRGTGKTTMARILAKALMCEQGPAALPDGSCEQCQLIAAGEHPDVIELDAASRTGVDNVREEIISRVNYAPALGRCKVYIIDEVHMLTTQAFNALLKTLEEPPEHVVFIMCTTDPQKILATILSRVQRFDFHAIGNDEMQAHLAYVCGQEGFGYDEAALELVVRHARGGMRDALTTLEQLSVFGAGQVTLPVASDFLGEVSGSLLGQISRALAHRDVPTLFTQVAELVDAGRDLLQLTRELAAHLRDVYVVSVVPSSDDVVAARGAELDALRAEAAAFGSPDRLARVLTVLGDASSEMRTATNQRLVLEVAFTRLARPETDLTLDSLAERVADLERQVAILSVPGAPRQAPASTGEKNLEPVAASVPEPAPAPVAAPEPERASAPAPAPAAPVAKSPAPESAPAPVAPVPAPVSMPQPAPEPAAPVAPQQEQAAPAPKPKPTSQPKQAPSAPAAGLSNGNLQRTWKQVVDRLVAQAPAKGSLLLSSTAVSDDGERLTVSLPKGSHFAARMLERADVRETVEPAVAAAFGPRQVIYVESSLVNQAISRSERPMTAPVPAPVAASAPAPRPTPQPAPAPQPGPAPQPAPAAPAPAPAPQPAPAAPAPAPAPQPAPALESTGYPMPWDAPAPAPDDVVPYTDADVIAYEEVYEPDVSVPAPAPAPRPAPTPAAPPSSAPKPAPAPTPAPTPQAPAPAAPAPAPTPAAAAPAPEPPADLTPEFADIAAMLTAAFGAPVSVSVEPAATTSDEDAAAELAYDDDPANDAGFTDEPVEDGDED